MSKDAAVYSRGRTYYVAGVGILFDHGTCVPADGVADYAPGCIFQKTDGTADACLYVNQGTLSSAEFKPLDIGALLATNIPVVDTVDWFTAINAETVLAEIGDLLLANSAAAAGVGPSPAIWSGAPLLEVILDPTKGFYLFDDFTKYGGLAVTGNGSSQGLTFTERTEGTLDNLPTIPGGVVALSSVNNTADQGGTMQVLGCQVEPLTGTTIRMEWRVKVSEDGGQCFMGLCDDSVTAAVSSSDAIVVNDLVGFYRDAGTGDTDWTAGCADGASADESDDKATSVKTTYHKYGIVIAGKGGVTGSTIKYYFDGVLVYTTTDTADIPLLLMCPCFQMDGDGTDIVTMSIDWMRILVSHATGLCRET